MADRFVRRISVELAVKQLEVSRRRIFKIAVNAVMALLAVQHRRVFLPDDRRVGVYFGHQLRIRHVQALCQLPQRIDGRIAAALFDFRHHRRADAGRLRQLALRHIPLAALFFQIPRNDISQFHIMLDSQPQNDFLSNIKDLLIIIYNSVLPLDGSRHHMACMIGILTISMILLWNLIPNKKLKAIPSALVGVIAASLVANAAHLDISYLQVGENFWSNINFIKPADFTHIFNMSIIFNAFELVALKSKVVSLIKVV